MDTVSDSSGLVYILLNPAMPGLVKIGFTTATAEQRARKLRTTGVPAGFVVLWDEIVDDALGVEQAVHRDLDAYRYRPDREFFDVPPKLAIRTLMDCALGHRLSISPRRSRNFIDALDPTIRESLPVGLVEIWLEYERGAISIAAASEGRASVIKINLQRVVPDGGPLFSPLDPPDRSADLLVQSDPEVVRRVFDVFL